MVLRALPFIYCVSEVGGPDELLTIDTVFRIFRLFSSSALARAADPTYFYYTDWINLYCWFGDND